MKSQTPRDEQRPKLLLVAYDFPPIASAGMLRMVGMTKYLQRKNWEITVLTVKRSFVHTSEATLRLIPEGVKVVRTWSVEILRLERWLVQKIEGRSDSEPWAESPGNGSGRLRWRRTCSRIVKRILKLIRQATTFPDARAGWFLPLLYRSWRLIAADRYDVVLSSSPPHSLHLALLVLRKAIRFRWVTDFRDPWTIPNVWGRRGWRIGIRRWLESKVLATCDAIVANTPGNHDALVGRFGTLIEEKTVVITNGFDNELARDRAIPNVDRPDCDLVYTGEVYRGMLDSYVQALRFMREQGTTPLPRLWVFGPVPGDVILRGILDNHLQGSIEFKGRIPLDRSLQLVGSARALLLLVPQGRRYAGWVPSKLYPYLFSRTPILVLAPQGDATRIVETTGRGVAVTSEDPAEVAAAITCFLDSVRTDSLSLTTNEDELGKYRMSVLADKLDGVLRRKKGVVLDCGSEKALRRWKL